MARAAAAAILSSVPRVAAPRAPRPWRGHALGLFALGPVLALALMSPVIRGPGFHRYADDRALLGVPNAGDVVSNLPFVVVGLAGLALVRRAHGLPRALVALFFVSVAGIGLGSAAYHAAPGDVTLALDWMPIVLTLAFLVSLLLADRVDRRTGTLAAVVLPAIAIGAVLWWWGGGGTAGGDMRWYAGLQLSMVVAVPVIVAMYPRGRLAARYLLLGVACFVLARLTNAADASLLATTGVSGHSLKHVVAAAATGCVYLAVRRAALAAPR